MNVNTAVLWDVRPCTAVQRCRRFRGTVCPSSEFGNLLLLTVYQKFLPMLVSIHQATWQH